MMSISFAVVCDICNSAMDTMGRSIAEARREAKACGWSSSKDRDRCPECKRDGLAYAHASGAKLGAGWPS